MTEKENEDNLNKDLALVSACFLGSKFEKPKILSGLNKTFVPETSVYFKIGLGQTELSPNANVSEKLEFNRDDQPDINCLDLIYISFTLPAIVANHQSAKAGYCDLPALNMFKTIKLAINGNFSTETFTPLSLDLALREYYKDKYHYIANNWLGGIDGPNQKISYCNVYHTDSEKINIIKKSIKCILPLPFHIFRNKNLKVKLYNQPISILLIMDTYDNIINQNSLFSLGTAPKIPIEFFCQAITTDESIFNNMPHVTPLANETYIEADESYSVICDNKAANGSDLKIELQPVPTTKYWVQVGSAKLSKKDLRFGETTEKAKQNFFAAMLKIKTPSCDVDGLIDLNKVEFTKNSQSVNKNPKSHADYQLEKIDDKSFAVYWTTTTQQAAYEILFTFNIELSCFPEGFCIDLFNYKNTTGLNLNLRFEYFSMVNFQFEKYNKFNSLHTENVNGNATSFVNDVPHYYFSFIGSNKIKYIFTEVNSIQKSRNITQNMLDIAAGMPLNSNELRQPFSPAAWKSFVRSSKPNWPYYDLDGNIPIKVESKKIGETEFPPDIIQLEKRINDESQFNLFKNFQISSKFSFDQSNGFFIPPASISYILAKNEFTYDINDNEGEINKHLMISVIQSFLKHYKYTNSKIAYLKASDYRVLATEVLQEEIGENGRFSDFHVYREIEQEDLSDLINLSKKKRKLIEDFPRKITNINQMVHNGNVKKNQIDVQKNFFYR